MRGTIAAVMVVGALLAPTPAHADMPKGVASVVHGDIGNRQGIEVLCGNGAGTKFLLKGESALDRCGGNQVLGWYVPPNFDLCTRHLNEAGMGCMRRYSGGTWWFLESQRNEYVWSVHIRKRSSWS